MIIDLDSKFRMFLESWLKENADKYANPEDMELDALDIYSKWLNTPADWLDGECPKNCFSKYKSSGELVEVLVEYLNARVGVPDLLLDAVSEFGQDAKEPLTKLFNLEYEIKGDNQEEARMLAINLLAETDDTFLHDDYVRLLLDIGTNEETANLIVERLEYAQKQVADKIISGLNAVDDEDVKTRCMDVLVNFPDDDRIFRMLIAMFNEYTNTALFAAYLGKYGDDRAINILEEALDWQGINYMDYIEIRNAIEQLGKEVDHVRTFEGDTYYESLKNIE